MAHVLLHVCDDLPGIGLVPAPVQLLGHDPELDNEVAREILRLSLAALFAPEPEQGGPVITHDDFGIGAAYEVPTAFNVLPGTLNHLFLARSQNDIKNIKLGYEPSQ